jgi:hypothetical protein
MTIRPECLLVVVLASLCGVAEAYHQGGAIGGSVAGVVSQSSARSLSPSLQHALLPVQLILIADIFAGVKTCGSNASTASKLLWCLLIFFFPVRRRRDTTDGLRACACACHVCVCAGRRLGGLVLLRPSRATIGRE